MTEIARTEPTRGQFQEYIRQGHFLAGSPELVPMTLALYRQLAEGRPVKRAQLAEDLNLSFEQIGRLLDDLPASTIDTDERGDIVAFGGLSLVPANHVFKIDELELHTWCVFDALFLPQLLGRAATLLTYCPATNVRIEIALTPEIITWSEPTDPVMSIVAPDRDSCCENLRGAFCNHVNFFVGVEAFRTWAAGSPEVGHVTLDQAHALGRQRNFYRYGDRLSVDRTARLDDNGSGEIG